MICDEEELDVLNFSFCFSLAKYIRSQFEKLWQ